MSDELEKLEKIKSEHVHWDEEGRCLSHIANQSACGTCSSSSTGDGCHGDGTCGVDGD